MGGHLTRSELDAVSTTRPIIIWDASVHFAYANSPYMAQIGVNNTEAQHASVFVAGWRPAVGWIGAAALAYQFLLYPMLTWVWALAQANGYLPGGMQPPPVLDADALWVILSGILGIAGMRSFEKSRGVTR